jgi:hypothetical protein
MAVGHWISRQSVHFVLSNSQAVAVGDGRSATAIWTITWQRGRYVIGTFVCMMFAAVGTFPTQAEQQ